MKNIIVVIFIFSFNNSFCQDSLKVINKKNNYDSLWYFHPFSIDLSAGMFIPIGKLSSYFDPSFQFSFGFGLMASRKTRIQLWLNPKSLNQKKDLPTNEQDSNTTFKTSLMGSLGGSLALRVFSNKWMCTEISGGLSWDFIPAVIKNPDHENDSITISGLGVSIGFNSWFNAWSRTNLGFKFIYMYSTVSNSSYFNKNIGNHSLSLSLMFRYPRRMKENWKNLY